jgi:hypothetical protein
MHHQKLLIQTSHYKEVDCTEPSLSGRVPWPKQTPLCYKHLLQPTNSYNKNRWVLSPTCEAPKNNHSLIRNKASAIYLNVCAITIDIKSLQNRLLKVCYVPVTSTSLSKLFLASAFNSTNEANKADSMHF